MIGNSIRKHRIKINKSQQEVADLLDIDRRTYIKWENNESNVKSEYIPNLAKILGIEIQDLFENTQSNIQINQENKENRDNSINNSIVLVLPDKESVESLVKAIESFKIKN